MLAISIREYVIVAERHRMVSQLLARGEFKAAAILMVSDWIGGIR